MEHEIFYNCCKNYYLHNDVNSKEVLEWFQQCAPKSSSESVTIDLSASFSGLQEVFDPSLIKRIISEAELWYAFNATKDKARSDAHKILGKEREEKCLQSAQRIHENSALGNSVAVNLLLQLLNDAEFDSGLYSSIITGIYVFIKQQLDNGQFCLCWKVELYSVSERQEKIQVDFLLFMSSIATYHGNFCYRFRSELTDNFLGRLLRIIQKSFRNNKINMGEIDRDRYVIGLNDSDDSLSSSTPLLRSDPQGRGEDITTCIENTLLPCPIL